jgi:hypothetical protein
LQCGILYAKTQSQVGSTGTFREKRKSKKQEKRRKNGKENRGKRGGSKRGKKERENRTKPTSLQHSTLFQEASNRVNAKIAMLNEAMDHLDQSLLDLSDSLDHLDQDLLGLSGSLNQLLHDHLQRENVGKTGFGEQNAALGAEGDRDQPQTLADILSVGKTTEDDNLQAPNGKLGGPSISAEVNRLEGIMRTIAEGLGIEEVMILRIEDGERMSIEEAERSRAEDAEIERAEEAEMQRAEEAERVKAEDATQQQPPAAGWGRGCILM